jgi:nucleoside-diphosphate-sugar epimerase
VDVLVTGGAGFIGSHLVDALVARGDRVRVLDDLFSGRRENVAAAAELVEGSITDAATVERAVAGCEVVFHLAAHGAVARSLADPLASNEANVRGTLCVLTASRDSGVRRVVFASSSSVYGGAAVVPTPEETPLRPRSPYAVSKLAAEWYTRVFGELFELETVALRYFNVFGPRQRPDSTYAAVIPLFARAVLNGGGPTVHGDGTQTRDFTFVADVVAANLCAATAAAAQCTGRAFNVAPGTSHSLLQLLDALGEITGRDVQPQFTESRAGDVTHSQADATAARRDLAWAPQWSFVDGLRATVEWLRAPD